MCEWRGIHDEQQPRELSPIMLAGLLKQLQIRRAQFGQCDALPIPKALALPA
jgi:hypothetical protein